VVVNRKSVHTQDLIVYRYGGQAVPSFGSFRYYITRIPLVRSPSLVMNSLYEIRKVVNEPTRYGKFRLTMSVVPVNGFDSFLKHRVVRFVKREVDSSEGVHFLVALHRNHTWKKISMLFPHCSVIGVTQVSLKRQFVKFDDVTGHYVPVNSDVTM